MKIMISACLAGENCKYNVGNNRNEKILQLMAGNEVITVCPEQMGGLPIPGAICIPNENIGTEQPEELPDLDQIILIYCRSGNRSKQAAQFY